MPEILRKLLSILLLLAIMVGMVPACGPSSASSDHSMDNAMLLALASHEQLELGQGDVSSSNIGGNLLGKTVSQPAAATKNNPNAQLSAIYAKFAESQSEGSASRIHFESKANEYALLADALTIARVRRAQRRGRGFQRFIRRLARAPVNVSKGVARGVGKLLKGTFRVTGTILAVAAEHIPHLARDYVMQKLRDLRNLAQGKIELTWDKVAARLGGPFAVWLRSRIDPAFVRLRDRVVARVLGKKQPERDTEENDEEGSGDDGEEGYDQPENVEISYGNYKVVVDNHGDNWGYFSWIDYWTNLPETYLDRCQWLSKSTGDAEAYLDDFEMELEFELDSGQLKGTFAHDGTYDITYQKSEWVLAGVIEDGWVQPAPDASGWIFGGTAVVEVTMHDRWRCHHCVQGEGGCVDMLVQWLEDEKTKEVKAKVEGWTEQVVPGKGDDPDRLVPGGAYTLIVSYEGSDADMVIDCERCVLPADFPPPVYIEE